MRDATRCMPLSYGISDQGPRENNEDELHYDDERGIYFVVDGMGGHAAGEHAARIAKERLIGRLERPIGTVEQRIREAIALANNAVHAAAGAQPEWDGMACVMTVAVVADGQVTVGHVGDSRLYRLTAKGLEKVTRDHSPVGQKEDAGELTEAEAMRDPRRNEVFRDVGSEPHEPDDPSFIDIYPPFPFDATSAFFLCSDGLSDALSRNEICTIISENLGDRTAIVRELVRQAAENGKDNVTVVFVHGPSFGAAIGKNIALRDKRNNKAAARKSTETRTKAKPVAASAPRALPAQATVERLVTPENQRPAWRFLTPLLWVVIGVALTLTTEYLLHLPPFKAKPVVQGQHHYYVKPSPGATPISAALAKASPGDTIDIAPGEYRDEIALKDGVTLSGTNAIIRPPETGAPDAAGIVADQISGATVSGLHLLAGANKRFAIGISVRGGRVSLHDVEVSGASLAGIEFSGSATGEITGSRITGNQGAGLIIRDDAALLVTDNFIADNGRSTPRSPGLQILSTKSVQISGNTFLTNGAEAIWQPDSPAPELLTSNIFGPDGAHGRPRDVRVTTIAPAAARPAR
jgi:serine/threonine protein phosphatase PrpC